MKWLKWLWKHSLTFKFYDSLQSLYYYIKDKSLVSDTLYGNAFKLVIKQYLKGDLRKDWLGRLYCVINPNIDSNGKIDINNIIMEMDGENTNSNEYVKTWVYKQMRLIGQLFKINQLYDYINIDFEHVGPESEDNYLVIFDIATRKIWAESFKKFIKHFSIVAVCAAVVIGIIVVI